MNEIESLNYDIIANVYELDEVQQILKSYLLDNPLTPESEIYLSEMGDRQIKLCKKIRILLECYFVEEKANELPKMLSYHRLYKQLKDF